jgi:hypothetical protein
MRTRILLVLLGGAAIGYGMVGVLRTAADSHPVRWALDLVAASLVHDLLLVPVVLLLVAAGRHWLPASWRVPAAVFLVVGGTLTLIAVPVLGRPGARPDNQTLLPRDYPVGLAVALAVVAVAVVLGTLLVRTSRRRRTQP